jgi:hypothetical protein
VVEPRLLVKTRNKASILLKLEVEPIEPDSDLNRLFFSVSVNVMDHALFNDLYAEACLTRVADDPNEIFKVILRLLKRLLFRPNESLRIVSQPLL